MMNSGINYLMYLLLSYNKVNFKCMDVDHIFLFIY